MTISNALFFSFSGRLTVLVASQRVVHARPYSPCLVRGPFAALGPHLLLQLESPSFPSPFPTAHFLSSSDPLHFICFRLFHYHYRLETSSSPSRPLYAIPSLTLFALDSPSSEHDSTWLPRNRAAQPLLSRIASSPFLSSDLFQIAI